MRWSLANAADDEGDLTTGGLQPANRRVRHGHALGIESITLGDAQLTSEIRWLMRLSHQDTLTEDEARQLFSDLLSVPPEPAASFALTKCLLLVSQLPPPIIPTVLEQFEEIAAYEKRIWLASHKEPHRIEERSTYLPVGK